MVFSIQVMLVSFRATGHIQESLGETAQIEPFLLSDWSVGRNVGHFVD